MAEVLTVPMQVDALHLEKSERAAEASADFRGLPYHDRANGRDVNSDTPWLGESAASAPFENSNLTLQAGMHLHWALPAGLRHGQVKDGKLEMPAVPNRWLVRRRGSTGVQERSWVIESDYLWPPSNQAPAVNILHASDDARPYRFLGRKLDLQQWMEDRKRQRPGGVGPDDVGDRYIEHEYFDGLTALGHGAPGFAAYYPDCMTVFGLHDGDLPSDWRQVHYDVLGWYGGAAVAPELEWTSEPDSPDGRSVSSRRWRIPGDAAGPQAIVCHAGIALRRDGSASAPPAVERKVALGNSVSEALSALLASEVAAELEQPALARAIEEQLEALHLDAELDAAEQDIGLRLRRYRHRTSFAPVPGRERWTLRTVRSTASGPPAALLDALRELDALEARHAAQAQRLVRARRQLHGDWCNYMRAVYRPPDGGRGQFLDVDEMVAFIETRSLAAVERLGAILGRTADERDRAEQSVVALVERINEEERVRHEAARAAGSSAPARTGEPAQPTRYELRSEPGARFWQPTDPVVLIATPFDFADEARVDASGHGPDGHLACGVVPLSAGSIDELISITSARTRLLRQLDTRSANGPFGVRRIDVARHAVTPLFLDWGIDLHAARSRAPGASNGYDPDLVTDNYRLGARHPDLQRAETLWTSDDPDRFTGRCVLGASPAMGLRARLEEMLQRRLQAPLQAIWKERDPTEPEARAYLGPLVSRWLHAAGEDSTATPFAALAGPWANAASEEAGERDYLDKLGDWYRTLAETHAGVPLESLPRTPEQLGALHDWYATRPLRAGSVRMDDPLYGILLAYRRLFVDGEREGGGEGELRTRTFLGQSLSGFNDELIQWKSALTLPMDEPIGLAPYRDFTARVARAVGDASAWTSEPTNDFSPLRSGALQLDRLRLLSRFGQTVDIPCDEAVIVPAPYKLPGRRGVAFLPPRLAQPARVTFRWLDTDPGESGEMIEAGERTPICGWLMPEKLGARLLVFAADGDPLGALAADRDTGELEWVRAPGRMPLDERRCGEGHKALRRICRRYHDSAVAGRDEEGLRDLGELGASVADPRLAQVLLYLWATRSPAFLEGFLNTLDDAMQNIDPEGVTSMGATALLLGRPVAVVGAELNLELAGEPAVRQDWSAFMQDQHRHHRGTDDFEAVRVPLRLGQFGSREDGVLGYWLESEAGFVDDTFVAQAADDDDPGRRLEIGTDGAALAARINAHDRSDGVDGLNFTQSVADPPLRTTLLMDPRGQAQLTSGILPAKRIDIPRNLWEPALEAMRVWFPTGPVVSRPGDRRIPVPDLLDRRWSWLELSDGSAGVHWQSVRVQPSVERGRLRHALHELARVATGASREEANAPAAARAMVPDIERLVERSWLLERSPADDRLDLGSREAREPLDDRALETPLDTLLAQLCSALVSPDDEPDLGQRAEVREGWLMLERGNGTDTP